MNHAEPQIIFEDDILLVLNKPAGMTVNNSETTHSQTTLQDWIAEKYKSQELFDNESEHDFDRRCGIVHRLDKETSGVIIAAKTLSAFEWLQAQFKERKVEKTYQALAHGVLSPKEGEITVPVGRLPWNRRQFGIVAGGRPSVTVYKTDVIYEKEKELLSLLTLFPQTGRTHQIRVHLKYIGHPIFSDFLYAGRKTARKDRNFLPRVFLHAFSIRFVHPSSKDFVSYEASLAKDLQDFLETLETLDEKQW